MYRLSVSDVRRRTGAIVALFENYHHQLAMMPAAPSHEMTLRLSRGVRHAVVANIRHDAKELMDAAMDLHFDAMGEDLQRQIVSYVDALAEQITSYLQQKIYSSVADRTAQMAKRAYLQELGVVGDSALLDFTVRDAAGRSQSVLRVVGLEVERFCCQVINGVAMASAIRNSATEITLASSGNTWGGVTLSLGEAISREPEWSHYGAATIVAELTYR